MNPLEFTRSVRSLNRLRHIAQVLTQHGFGYIVARTNLARYLPTTILRREPEEAGVAAPPASIGRRLALVFTELGPTFVKFGQMLTTRPDLLPKEIVLELECLQDQVPPFDSDVAMQIIADNLGAPVSASFEQIDLIPIASGSIGQVHAAHLPGGKPVIVKVRRPDIEGTVLTDMQLLRWLAESLERLVPEVRDFRPTMLVSEFEQTLLREMDFIYEASVLTRFYDAFAEDRTIRTPRVYWELTGTQVLTMERLDGKNVAQYLATDAECLNRRVIARKLVQAYLRQIFDIGAFHADPHPGNILVDPPADVGLIDFGQVGVLTEDLTTQLVTCIYAAVSKEVGILVDTLGHMGAVPATADRRQLQRDLRILLEKYYGLPLHRIELATLFHEFSRVIRQHGVIVPREVPMLIKAVSMAAETARRLDPELNLLALLEPKLRENMRQRLSPSRLLRNAGVSGWQALVALRYAPRQISDLVRKLSTGQWDLNVKHENIDRLAEELDRSSNRLSLAVVIAAIIIGSSVVIRSTPDLMVFGVPVQSMGVVGYLLAGVMGLGLSWAIFRSGRLH